jgi:hypothetical protein
MDPRGRIQQGFQIVMRFDIDSTQSPPLGVFGAAQRGLSGLFLSHLLIFPLSDARSIH